MDISQVLEKADALHKSKYYASAIAAYQSALARDALLLEAWYGLGCTNLAMRAYGAAAEALRRAVALRPDADGARCSLAEALFGLGDVDGAIAEFQHASRTDDPEIRAVALGNIACISPGSLGCDNSAVLAARRRWVDLAAVEEPVVRPVAKRNTGRLRIGYLSAFFGERNWMKPVWGVINHHDRDKFQIHLLSDGDDPSADSGYVDYPEDYIWQLGGISNGELARRIAEARLDVLVDLNGYSWQRRLPLFRYRSAPFQVSWMGMYGTTGIPEIDCVVGDASVIPPEEEQFYCERVARVPGSYLAFTVPYSVPELVPPPCLTAGRLTFGCLASAYKLTETTIEAYARILHCAPSSRLLFRNRTLDEASNRATLMSRFAHLGIGSDRLLLESGTEHFEFLRTYDRVDLALDTFPYNGGTTTAEAMWQGVPTLTFNGDRWASRTSHSLLQAAGLGEFVATDRPSFEAACIAIATAPDTPARLLTLRTDMRQRLRRSAACDVETLCRSLEALYLDPSVISVDRQELGV